MRRRLVWIQGVACGPNRTLSNGNLSLTIGDIGGAITQVLFGGRDWYNPGTPISDYVIGLNGSLFFRFADARGISFEGSRVCGNSSELTVDKYPFGPVKWSRRYTLHPTANAFIVSTTFVNPTESPVLVEFADTFDPDQDWSFNGNFNTSNRLISIGGITATQAVGEDTPYTVIMGSPNTESVVEAANNAGGYFNINGLSDLQTFLTSPYDAAGVVGDAGIHCGFRKTLQPEESYTFTMLQGFGTTTPAAESAFLTALQSL